jgi:hypothetical protein
MLDTGVSSHMSLHRNYFESLLLFQGKVVLVDKSQVEYPSIGLVYLSWRVTYKNISVILLCYILFGLSLQRSFYSWKSVKSIGYYALINHSDLHVVCKVDRFVVINIF